MPHHHSDLGLDNPMTYSCAECGDEMSEAQADACGDVFLCSLCRGNLEAGGFIDSDDDDEDDEDFEDF